MRRFALFCIIMTLCFSLSGFAPSQTQAQSDNRYENRQMGLSFDLPDGWTVEARLDALTASSAEGLAALEANQAPSDLILRVITGTFIQLGIENIMDLPAQLNRLVPTGIRAPEAAPVSYGNLEGWEIEYGLAEGGLVNRVALIGLSNGRVALIRGFAPEANWEAAAATYDAIRDSLEFFTPDYLMNPFEGLPDRDGGVLWHYQSSQPADALPVNLGGIVYDPFLLIYVAAGNRGLLVLDQTDGSFINYYGPFVGEANITDIAISRDARLFLANATPRSSNQIMMVNRAGAYEYGFGSTGEDRGQFAPLMPHTLVMNRQDEIWTVSEGHETAPAKRLYRFDRFGNLLAQIDLDTINPALVNVRLGINPNNNTLYLIGDEGGINIVDAAGQPLVTSIAAELFEQISPLDIVVAPNDNIIVSTSNAGILEFSPAGQLIDRFGIPLAEDHSERFRPGEMRAPNGLMVSLDSEIFFAETNPNSGFNQVQVITFSGDGNLPLPTRAEDVPTLGLSIDPASGGGAISDGDTVQGGLNNQFSTHDWTFQAQAGDQIRVTMRDISLEGTLDPLLILVDSLLNELARNDDLEGTPPQGFKATDAILEFTIRTSGTYSIRATRFGGRGEYELSFEKLND